MHTWPYHQIRLVNTAAAWPHYHSPLSTCSINKNAGIVLVAWHAVHRPLYMCVSCIHTYWSVAIGSTVHTCSLSPPPPPLPALQAYGMWQTDNMLVQYDGYIFPHVLSIFEMCRNFRLSNISYCIIIIFSLWGYFWRGWLGQWLYNPSTLGANGSVLMKRF